MQRSAFHTHVSRASGAVERLQATQDRPNLRKRASKRTGRLSEGASGEMEERLERLQERDGRLSAVVRLVQCITGPRLRRQYFVGTDSAVIVGGGHYLETLQCPMSFVTCVCVCVQGMPYTPNKLEQYAESVVIAVSLSTNHLTSIAIMILPILRPTCSAPLPSTRPLCTSCTTYSDMVRNLHRSTSSSVSFVATQGCRQL